MKEIQADFELIEISSKADPRLFRKGFVGESLNEMTPHQANVIWNAGAVSMDQFGYTQSGQLLPRKRSFLLGFNVISVDRIVKYNTQVGEIFAQREGARCFIFDDGFYFNLHVEDLASAFEITDDDENGLYRLEVVWDDKNNRGGRWMRLFNATDNQTAK